VRVQWPSTAFVDETQGVDWYLLAAVIVEDRGLEEYRREAVRWRVGGPKVHWWAERADRRNMLATNLQRLDLRQLVVVRLRRPNERDERCRRKCLETLLINLERIGVETVVFESRERRQNDGDREASDYLRRSKVLRGTLRLEHRAGRTEPLLWLADVLAGAVRVARGGSDEYAALLGAVEIIEV
jgi:hypothetical protein